MKDAVTVLNEETLRSISSTCCSLSTSPSLHITHESFILIRCLHVSEVKIKMQSSSFRNDNTHEGVKDLIPRELLHACFETVLTGGYFFKYYQLK